jgi:hypothetical protein
VPDPLAREIARRTVVAGEACTEIGLDVARSAPSSLTERWLRPQAPPVER